jgi:hypothetical protein
MKPVKSNRASGVVVLKKRYYQPLLILARAKECIFFMRNSAAYPSHSQEAK